MSRVLVALAFAGSVLAAAPASPQAVPKVPRVGALFIGPPTAIEGPGGGLATGMRELGYSEGRGIAFEWRYAEGRPERLDALAADLVAAGVDVIVAGGPGPLAAARRATTKIPIVAVAGSDPVAEGWAKSLARPGGNVTGLSVTFPELEQKRLEILKELLPGAQRVAVVFAPLELPDGGRDLLRDLDGAARRLGLQVRPLAVRTPADLDTIGATLREGRTQAAFTVETTFVLASRRRIAETAAQHGVPVVGEFTIFGADELLMAYGADLNDLLRRAASHVDRILRGARASELPIERPAKFELLVNRKLAGRLGVAIPPSVLLRADRVIE